MSPEVIVAGGLAVAVVIALGVFALARSASRADDAMARHARMRRALGGDDGVSTPTTNLLLGISLGGLLLVILVAFDAVGLK